jgi:creatinine amidohydrolase/Fe(II)-dependent formamide hydrolase-like protein
VTWHRLEEMTWQEVAAFVPKSSDLIFLPVGTIEAHGSAAIGTDNIIPISIGEYLAERFSAVLAPCVHYGITKSLYGYAGSLGIKPEHFAAYMLDILDSLADKKFKRVVIVNGHGGNNSVLKDVAHQGFRDFHLKVAVLHWWHLCSDITQEVYGSPGAHAGIDETGFVMAVDPKYGKKDAYDPKLAYLVEGGADVYPIPGSVLIYNKEKLGEPDFDVEKGREFAARVKARMGDYLEDLFDRWASFFPDE